MEILAFFGSVWLAIITGVFILAMVVGCTFDRRQHESAKWWIFFLGLGAYAIYSWTTGYRFSWDAFVSADLWKFIGIYLAIGVGYSIIEFVLDVRRSVRYWKERWASFLTSQRARTKSGEMESAEDLANSFVANSYRGDRIIGVEYNKDSKDTNNLITPKINRTELAEHIGCWILFWPFYAVSLIIGDLVMEIARVIADIFAKISGRFVRMSFANVFKF